MALIKCSECGKKISDKGEACVHCGCPLNITLEKLSITKAKPKCPKCGVERRPGETECWGFKCGVVYEKYEAFLGSVKRQVVKTGLTETPKEEPAVSNTVKCHGCGKPISVNASMKAVSVCPHCGTSLKYAKISDLGTDLIKGGCALGTLAITLPILILIVVVILGMIGMLFSC